MQLELLDKAIVLGYLVIVLALGVILSKVASKGVEDYFLGGRSIPWWVLGASGTASNFDMTGTMVIVSLIYLLGFKGFWVEMRGGVALPLAFLMAFMGKWTRRSHVMTGAEWMVFRYGKGRAGNAARILSSISYLVLSVGMVAYFSVGTGTFLQQFLPGWTRTGCASIMVGIGLCYTLMSGLYGVVFTDVVQEIIITITAIYISVKAFFLYDPSFFPAGWTNFELPIRLTELAQYPDSYREFELFALCVVFWVGKAVLEGTGGLGGYMAQRYFAARNEREAGLLTAEWIVLLGFRWTMIAGLALMGLSLAAGSPAIAATLHANPERVLPMVLEHMLPTGLKGLAIAGFMAAAMSTFDSTVNAGASYWVVDIYQAYIDPDADQEVLVRQSWVATTVIAVVGVLLAMTIQNINEVWGFITGALSAGFMIPLFLRWYWNRHNGYGFAWGTGAGILAATLVQLAPTLGLSSRPLALYEGFPLVCAISLLASIVGTYATEATPAQVLLDFYRKTRPWGLWKQQSEEVHRREAMEITIEHLYDLLTLVLALPWQMSLFFGAMSFVVHAWSKFLVCVLVFSFCSVSLYFTWYRNLRDPETTGEAEEARRQQETLERALDAEDEAREAERQRVAQRSSAAQERRASSKRAAVKKAKKRA